MNKIFIEAKDKRTSEYYFLKTILSQFFPDKEVDFIPMNGIGNLFHEAILNQMSLAQDSGDWLFDNVNYWDLKVATLQPLRDFLATHLK